MTSISSAAVRAWGGFGAIGLVGMVLVACGATIDDVPSGSSGSSGSTGGQRATGNGGSGPSNGGAGAASAEAPSKRYSLDACKRAGGQPVPSKGGPQTPETDCESGVALGIIDAASSGWDEGGLCCAVGKDPVLRACGARAGDTCSATEYCAYEPAQLCGAADAQSVCTPRPEQCVELDSPVCGCDQKTYDNSCYANAAGTGIFKAGKCGEFDF